MRLYFAGPLFSVQEREFNTRLAAAIEALGYDVFLPQRDGFEASESELVEGPEVARQIFALDSTQVMDCDVLLCVLDGRVPDEGMAVEIGIAHADRLRRTRQRRLIGLSTDSRQRGGAALNAMIVGALDEIHTEEAALLERLGEIIRA